MKNDLLFGFESVSVESQTWNNVEDFKKDTEIFDIPAATIINNNGDRTSYSSMQQVLLILNSKFRENIKEFIVYCVESLKDNIIITTYSYK